MSSKGRSVRLESVILDRRQIATGIYDYRRRVPERVSDGTVLRVVDVFEMREGGAVGGGSLYGNRVRWRWAWVPPGVGVLVR